MKEWRQLTRLEKRRLVKALGGGLRFRQVQQLLNRLQFPLVLPFSEMLTRTLLRVYSNGAVAQHMNHTAKFFESTS